MFIAALLAVIKNWKQPKCPRTGGWINKSWYIQTMENHCAIGIQTDESHKNHVKEVKLKRVSTV